MNPESAERAAVRVGLFTTVIGFLLVFAPARVGPPVGLTDPRAARAVGLADLVLVPGLLRGRPRWAWLSARAGLNLVIAGYAVATGQRSRRAQVLAAGLMVATVFDTAAVAALRSVDK